MRASLVLAGALCLTISACGSDGGSSGSSKEPIRVYQIAPIESQAVSVPEMGASAKAAVSAVNAAGGVKGRKIELTVCNDKADPNESLRCAQKAVREDAAAVVGSLSLYAAQILPVLAKADIAYIHPVAVSPTEGTAPNSFVLNQGTVSYSAQPYAAKEFLGVDKVAIFQDESPVTELNTKLFELGAKKADVEIVDNITIPLDTVDPAQYVARAESKGAQAILMTPTAERTLKIWKVLESSGSTLKLVFSADTLGPETTKAAGATATGSIAVTGAPVPNDQNEWGKQYLAEMAKYQPSEKTVSGVGFTGWSAVHLFAQVANGIDGDITSKSVLDALAGLHDEKFMWIDSLSFDTAGPYPDAPRLASTTIYPSEVDESGEFVAKEPFDIFAK